MTFFLKNPYVKQKKSIDDPIRAIYNHHINRIELKIMLGNGNGNSILEGGKAC